jgi:hypothetical protein
VVSGIAMLPDLVHAGVVGTSGWHRPTSRSERGAVYLRDGRGYADSAQLAPSPIRLLLSRRAASMLKNEAVATLLLGAMVGRTKCSND